MILKMELFWRLPAGLLLFGFASRCTASDDTNYFVWPPAANGTDGGQLQDDVSLPWSTEQTVRFVTNYTSYTVDLYQNTAINAPAEEYKYITTINNHIVNNPNFHPPNASIDETTNVSWTVSTYDADPRNGSVFYFWIQNADDPAQTQFFMSHYFNITGTEDNTSPSSTASSTTLSSTASSTSAATSNTTSNTLDSSTPKSSDSNSLKIALGCGLGVGFIVVILLAWYALIVVRRRRKEGHDVETSNHVPINREGAPASFVSEDAATSAKDSSIGDMVEIPDHAIHEAPQTNEIYEIPDHAIVEAPDAVKSEKEIMRQPEPVELSSQPRFSFE